MKNWLFILLYCLLSSCVNKEKSKIIPLKNIKQKKIITTEKFDIATFEENKVDGEYNFITEKDSKVRQLNDAVSYSEYITPPPPNYFETYNEYFVTGELKSKLISFPNNFLKHYWIYNIKGELIDETDHDIPYKFTFEQLVKLIENENDDIDILDKKNTTIGRKSDEDGTFWFVRYKKVPMRREVIKVDGLSGEILERSFYPHVDN